MRLSWRFPANASLDTPDNGLLRRATPLVAEWLAGVRDRGGRGVRVRAGILQVFQTPKTSRSLVSSVAKRTIGGLLLFGVANVVLWAIVAYMTVNPLLPEAERMVNLLWLAGTALAGTVNGVLAYVLYRKDDWRGPPVAGIFAILLVLTGVPDLAWAPFAVFGLLRALTGATLLVLLWKEHRAARPA